MTQSEEGAPPVNKLLRIIKQLEKIIRIRRHFDYLLTRFDVYHLGEVSSRVVLRPQLTHDVVAYVTGGHVQLNKTTTKNEQQLGSIRT